MQLFMDCPDCTQSVVNLNCTQDNFFLGKKAALGLLYALPLPCGVIDIYMHGCVSVTE